MKQFKNNDIIGITGVIGSGKSFFANSFESIYSEYSGKLNIIEIDDIRRDLLWKDKTSLALSFRQKIITEFDITDYDDNLFFNREVFTQFIFSHVSILKKFNELCHPFFIAEINNRKDVEKINFLVWVNLIEDNYLTLLNYLIFVEVSEKTWIQRNLPDLENLQSRIKFQTNYEDKLKLLNHISTPFEVYYNE